MSNYAIDTAARFGEIPFVEFTKDLVTGVFDALVEAHILQMEEYANFVSTVSQDLTTYINNTQDNVSFDQISDFILNYDLPKVDENALNTVLTALQTSTGNPTIAQPDATQPATASTWWGGLINALSPAVTSLVDKINDPSKIAGLEAVDKYNKDVLAGATATVPSYKQIHDSVAALIASNKYAVLQNIIKQGMMRLVVTEGEIETKITFSTWNTSTSGSEATHSDNTKTKVKNKVGAGFSFLGMFGASAKHKTKKRIVTINTAKSYQRDTSGTKVDIFGRVVVRFKTDYAPLNG